MKVILLTLIQVAILYATETDEELREKYDRCEDKYIEGENYFLCCNYNEYFDFDLFEFRMQDPKCKTVQMFENKCITCSTNRHNPPDCTCIDSTVEIENACHACSPKCQSCQNQIDQCTICSQGTGRDQQLPCNCLQGYYEQPDNIEQNCSKCDHQCSSCQNRSNNCLECIEPEKRTDSPFCNCKSGYYLGSDKNCHKCSDQCSKCENDKDNCTGCKEGQFRSLILPTCGCQENYFENDDENSIDCIQCAQKCKTCSDLNTCLTCNGDLTNRNPEPVCDCFSGYYEKNLKCHQCHTRCLECEQDKENCTACRDGEQRTGVSPDCGCNIGYFEIKDSNNCQQCHYKCQSCIYEEANCQTCGENRQNPPDCDCEKGMVEIENQCLQCEGQCIECTLSQNNCSTCRPGTGRKMEPPLCACKDGFYSDGVNINCIQCTYPCSTCINSPTFCLDCGYGLNRNEPPMCDCKPGYSEIQNSCTKECHYKCEKCNHENRSQCFECQQDYPYYIFQNKETQVKNCFAQCPPNYDSLIPSDGIINYECQCIKEGGCNNIFDQVDEVIVHSGNGYTNVTQSGSIERCNQEGCLKCWGLPASLCEICKIGFYLDQQQICQRCDQACQSCTGPGVEKCVFCNSMQIQSISEINNNNCVQFSQKEFYEFDPKVENNDMLKYNRPNSNNKRRILNEQQQSNMQNLEIFERFCKNRVSMQDDGLQNIEMKVKDVNNPCIQSPCEINFFTVSEKGQQLVIIKNILDMASIIDDKTNSKYSIESLNSYFFNNKQFIQLKKEPRIKSIIDYIKQWGNSQKSDQYYYYTISDTFKLGEVAWIQFEDIHGLNEDIQENKFFKSQCSAVNNGKLLQAEKNVVNLDLDTFYILQVCDTEKGKIKQGIYLRKSDLIEDTQFHTMYDINTGLDIDFLLKNTLNYPTQVTNIHQILSYQKVKIYRIPKYQPSINQIINYDIDFSAKKIRKQQQKEFDGCSLSEVVGLEKQILQIHNKVYGVEYVDIEEQLKSVSDKINLKASLKYVHKNYTDDLIAAITEYSNNNPQDDINILSLQKTFIGEYMMYQHYIRNNRCGVDVASEPRYFPSNYIQGKAIEIETDGEQNKLQEIFQKYDMYCLKDIKNSHYNYKYNQGKTTSEEQDQYLKTNYKIVKKQIQIFQELYNCVANPFEKLSVDGQWGPKTQQKLQQSPSDGYDINIETCNFTNFNDINIFNNKVVQNVKERALVKSSGKCGVYVRTAIQIARGEIPRKMGFHAHQFGPLLKQWGYVKTTKTQEQATIGDIGVIEATEKHIYGHVAIKIENGKYGKWASDFLQNYFRIYTDDNPPYVIYTYSPE